MRYDSVTFRSNFYKYLHDIDILLRDFFIFYEKKPFGSSTLYKNILLIYRVYNFSCDSKPNGVTVDIHFVRFLMLFILV